VSDDPCPAKTATINGCGTFRLPISWPKQYKFGDPSAHLEESVQHRRGLTVCKSSSRQAWCVKRLYKKTPHKCGVFGQQNRGSLLLDYISGSRTFLAVNDIELDPSTLGKRLESLALDCRMMYEYILSTVLLNKTKTLRIIKPLYSTFDHFLLLLENRFRLRNQ
jgi:hypothetical protein